MNSVPRKLTLGLVIAVAAAACGDDVTVTNPPTTTPTVRSVIVSPPSATITAGSSFTFGAAVDADADVSRAVTWTASGGTGITVDAASGVASTTASASGVASICATATANTAIKGCAQLTVNPVTPAANATVEIRAMTIGCDNLAAVLSTGGCGLNQTVATNNVFGQMDVQVNVNRPAGSTVTGVRIDVFPVTNGVVGTTAEKTYQQALSTDFINASDALAAQQTQSNLVTIPIQTADYTINAAGAAVVTHPNGVKQLKVTLTTSGGTTGTATATALVTVTFRNINGFHVTAAPGNVTGSNNNNTPTPGGSAFPFRQTGANLWSWVGGVSMVITATPVNYTAVPLSATAGNYAVNFGSAACDQSGGGNRAIALTTAPTITSNTTAFSQTLAYTNGAAASATTLNSYETNPNPATCAAVNTGETPGATMIDGNGNNFLTTILSTLGAAGLPYGPTNTLNNPIRPVVPSLATATQFRIDNRGPSGVTPTIAANMNGRLNGWFNGNVQLNVRLATNVDGAVTSNPSDLGLNASTGNVASTTGVVLVARGGACTSAATCGALPPRTRVTADPAPTSAPNLAETPLGSTYNMIVQAYDPFGNFTNSNVLPFGVDVQLPTTTIVQSWAPATLVQFNAANALTPATQTWTVTATDGPSTTPGAVASGIRANGLTGSLLLDGLEMTLALRTPTGTTNFCPVNGQFQASGVACTTTGAGSGWITSTNPTFGRVPGAAIAVDPATVPVNTQGYYIMTVSSVDEAGNRSTPATRSLIFDTSLPINFGLATTPVPGSGGGTVTNTMGAVDNLDLSFSHFGIGYGSAAQPLLSPTNGGDALLQPMVVNTNGQQGVDPIGFSATSTTCCIQALNFSQALTPYQRTAHQVNAGNIIAARAQADIGANQLTGVTADVAGNLTAAALTIGLTTNAPVANPWTPGIGGFTGAFIASHTVNSVAGAAVFIAGGSAATRTVVFSANATGTAGWQAPFTAGGLDFWVLDQTPGRRGYVRACTAGSPQYNIGTLTWTYTCSWTPGNSIANGYLNPLAAATQYIAIGRNGTGDGLVTNPAAITISP